MNPVARAKLNHVFSKHASDFGVTGPWNQMNGALFEQALHDHINNPNVHAILGTHRGVKPVTHFYDPTTDVNVMVDAADDLDSGWRLDARQVNSLLTTGNVQ
jgi:Colicin D